MILGLAVQALRRREKPTSHLNCLFIAGFGDLQAAFGMDGDSEALAASGDGAHLLGGFATSACCFC